MEGKIVVHGTGGRKHLGNRGILLSDGDVNTQNIRLVQDSIHGDRRLACLSVTNDEFSLATPKSFRTITKAAFS